MTRTVLLDGPRAAPASGAPARQVVVLLHGYGADGHDLFGLARALAAHLPDAAFVSPNAPEPCAMAGFGYQWFSIEERTPAAMRAGVERAAPTLNAFLDAELARHRLAADRLALVGFSQGTMMSLYVGFRRPQACAAIVGFSGTLVGADHLSEEAVVRPPVLLVHGAADPLVPVLALHEAVRDLKTAGVAVEWEVRPGLPHAIDPEGLAHATRFLVSRLEVAR